MLETAEGESSVKGCGMVTIYMIQKVLDTAGRESPVLTIYIQKVLDTAEGKSPVGHVEVC